MQIDLLIDTFDKGRFAIDMSHRHLGEGEGRGSRLWQRDPAGTHSQQECNRCGQGDLAPGCRCPELDWLRAKGPELQHIILRVTVLQHGLPEQDPLGQSGGDLNLHGVLESSVELLHLVEVVPISLACFSGFEKVRLLIVGLDHGVAAKFEFIHVRVLLLGSSAPAPP